MHAFPEIWAVLATVIAAVASFIVGYMSGRAMRKRRDAALIANHETITLKVNGIKEPISIPAHYDSIAIDKLLHQLEIA